MKRQGILITIILIAIVAVVGGLAVSKMKTNKTAEVAVQPSPTITQTPADVDKDIQGIDTKLKALNADATNIDQSLNDQQGNLSEQ